MGFINDCYKVNPVGQWGKFLVMAMHTVLKAIICGAQTIGTRLKICMRIKIKKKYPAWGIEPGSSG